MTSHELGSLRSEKYLDSFFTKLDSGRWPRDIWGCDNDCPGKDLGANVPFGRSASDGTIALPVWDKIVHQANALPEVEPPAAGQGHDETPRSFG